MSLQKILNEKQTWNNGDVTHLIRVQSDVTVAAGLFTVRAFAVTENCVWSDEILHGYAILVTAPIKMVDTWVD